MEKQKRVYGLTGYPVKHSLSPAMHNAAFKALNIDAEYELFEVPPQDLDYFLNSLSKQNIFGLNITIPHKVQALKWVIENSTIAASIEIVLAGAINTIKIDGSKLYYYNTDIMGFINSLREDLKFNTKDKNILLFGCGGAGRAIIAGLTTKGTGIRKIYIYDVNDQAVESAKKHFDNFDEVKYKLEFISKEEQIADKIKNVDLLVNASPVGMKEGDGSIIDKNRLHEGLYVYDIVYNRETQLIKDAKARNLKYISGLKMLWRQGILSFEIWTEKKAPEEIMWKALCS